MDIIITSLKNSSTLNLDLIRMKTINIRRISTYPHLKVI